MTELTDEQLLNLLKRTHPREALYEIMPFMPSIQDGEAHPSIAVPILKKHGWNSFAELWEACAKEGLIPNKQGQKL